MLGDRSEDSLVELVPSCTVMCFGDQAQVTNQACMKSTLLFYWSEGSLFTVLGPITWYNYYETRVRVSRLKIELLSVPDEHSCSNSLLLWLILACPMFMTALFRSPRINLQNNGY